jgi:hypothetical protein
MDSKSLWTGWSVGTAGVGISLAAAWWVGWYVAAAAGLAISAIAVSIVAARSSGSA